MKKLEPITAVCKVCSKNWLVSGGAATYVRSGRKKYCSKECMGIAFSEAKKGYLPDHLATTSPKGETYWNWKGGITKEGKLERFKFYKTVQRSIFLRDNYTCQICDQYGGNLQVDHIKPWAEFPELRFVKSNCRTLCMACHYYITFKKKIPDGITWGHTLSRGILS